MLQTCATSSGPLFHITRQGLVLLNEATPAPHETGKEGVGSFPLLNKTFFFWQDNLCRGQGDFFLV